jgi:NAD(P)-dependent dehydrogenase (short-subunit alcohol dehydrogenase family)
MLSLRDRYREEGMGDRLKDNVALVSGAGSSGPGWGNGKATAVLFGREGAKVLAADINLDAAVEAKQITEPEGGSSPALWLCSTPGQAYARTRSCQE